MDPIRTLRLGLTGTLLALAATSPLEARQAAPPPPTSVDPLIARESAHPSGFPRILVLDAPGSGLVTFRLSVPIDPGVDGATAAPLLLALAEERVRGTAETLGARIELGSSAFALSYTVTGALVDLDHLAYLLRQATVAPHPSEGFATARSAIEARFAHIGETGEGRVEADLRIQAAPEETSLAEVRNRLRQFDFADMERIWRDTHQPSRMTLIVVGDVATPVLLAALSGLGSPPPSPPATAPLAPSNSGPDRPDLLRRWSGVAWASAATLDPRAAATASLAARYLREGRAGYEAYVRLWEGREHDVLAVVGSAYPRDVAALRQRLQSLPTDLAADIDAASLAQAVEQLRWTLMGQTRTPWGRANLIGRFLDTGAAPDAARRYIDGLVALTVADVRAYLDQLAATTPARSEAGR